MTLNILGILLLVTSRSSIVKSEVTKPHPEPSSIKSSPLLSQKDVKTFEKSEKSSEFLETPIAKNLNFGCKTFLGFLTKLTGDLKSKKFDENFFEIFGDDFKISKIEKLFGLLQALPLTCKSDTKSNFSGAGNTQVEISTGVIEKDRIFMSISFKIVRSSGKLSRVCFEIEQFLTQNEISYFKCFDSSDFNLESPTSDINPSIFSQIFPIYLRYIRKLYYQWSNPIRPLNVWQGFNTLLPFYLTKFFENDKKMKNFLPFELSVKQMRVSDEGLLAWFTFDKLPFGIFQIRIFQFDFHYLRITLKTTLQEFSIDVFRFLEIKSDLKVEKINELLGTNLNNRLQPIIVLFRQILAEENIPKFEEYLKEQSVWVQLLDPAIQPYVGTQLISFPIAFILLDSLLSKQQFTRLAFTEGQSPQSYFSNLGDHFFYIEKSAKPEILRLFDQTTLQELTMLPISEPLDWKKEFERLTPTRFERVYGHSLSNRKVRIVAYGYDFEGFNAFHIFVESLHFETEYLIAYASISEMHIIFEQIIVQINEKLLALSSVDRIKLEEGMPTHQLLPGRVKEMLDCGLKGVPLCFKPSESFSIDSEKPEDGISFEYFILETDEAFQSIQACDENLETAKRLAISLTVSSGNDGKMYKLIVHQPSAFIRVKNPKPEKLVDEIKPRISEYSFLASYPETHTSVVDTYISLATKNYLREYQFDKEKKSVEEMLKGMNFDGLNGSHRVLKLRNSAM